MDSTITSDELMPPYYRKKTLVLGCGNYLMGDDGFGPAVVEALEKRGGIPQDVHVEDVGTSAREILFQLVVGQFDLSRMIIIDGVDFSDRGRRPGEVFEIALDEIPVHKTDDFSMHQVPSSNLLRELRDNRNIEVIVLACQIQHIPEEVNVGLTEPVEGAIPAMCELVSRYWS